MDIMELGAIGELVGGVAVIASLIYVGVQVRQGNTVARSESIREIARESGQMFLQTCDPGLSRAIRRAIHDFDGLSNNEKSVASGWLAAFFILAQTTFVVRSSHRASRTEEVAAAFLAAKGLRNWWAASKTSFSPRFVETLEQLASEGTVPIDQLWPWYVLDESDQSGN